MKITYGKITVGVIIVFILNLCCLVAVGCEKPSEESAYRKEEIDMNEYVDEQIQAIVQSDAYKNASIDQREQIISHLLSQLKKEEAINNFLYEKGNYLFSFEYCDGTLGGVKIKDFDSYFD